MNMLNMLVRGNRRREDPIKDGCTNVESTETGQRQCTVAVMTYL